MYFDAVSDMLDNTEPSYEIKNLFFQDLYRWIKSVNKKQIKLLKSAIELLNRHMNYFRSLLYHDYQYWYEVLRHLSCEKSTLDCGQRALKTFYKIIGEILEDQNREESESVLWVSKINMKLSTVIMTRKTSHERDKKSNFFFNFFFNFSLVKNVVTELMTS